MTIREIAGMIDISAVRTDAAVQEVEDMCNVARRYGFIAVFSMPWYTPRVVELLHDQPAIHVGGVVAFPSGADLPETKVAVAQELVRMGCGEIDMVMNVGALKSGALAYVKKEIEAVRAVAKRQIMKVIIEAPLLTDEETRLATEIVASAGCDYVKSGTGWHGATPPERLSIMCETARGRCRVKAAGGVRGLDAVLRLRAMGVERFGIGLRSALDIMQEAQTRFLPHTEGKNEHHFIL